MPNYYDAPPDFTPDETVTFEVVMPQPEEEVEVDNVTFAGSHSGDDKSWAVFRYKDDLSISVELPYPLGARVGVREACIYCGGDGKETCDNPDHGFLNAMSFHDIGRIGCPCCGHDPKHKVPNGGDCPECEGKGWVVTVHYTVTAVDVVQRKGQWVEKVTMRSEK